MVKSLIHERSGLNYSANIEVRSKWALDQRITAPILSVPITFNEIINDKITEVKTLYHFLPDQLNIASEVQPRMLKRGIYEVIVYDSKLELSGHFHMPSDFTSNDFDEIHWDKAFLTTGVSDLRGIQSNNHLIWNGDTISSVPGSRNPTIVSGLTYSIDGLSEENFDEIPFNLEIDLQGSEKLTFVPTGKITKSSMISDWDSPSFSGNFLPDNREVTKEGFKADWAILQINRNYPQHWQGNKYARELESSAFGVDFIKPSDSYQKSIRSVKYALMNISLTFLIFFLVEIFTKTKIHPFQYVIIGLSILLFYILLVSLSEHISFPKSYLISATSVVSMIYLYSLSVFKSLKFSIYLLVLSVLNYGFIYITLQMTDYALLLGSVCMTGILAAVMYGTRNIDWYQLQRSQ